MINYYIRKVLTTRRPWFDMYFDIWMINYYISRVEGAFV